MGEDTLKHPPQDLDGQYLLCSGDQCVKVYVHLVRVIIPIWRWAIRHPTNVVRQQQEIIDLLPQQPQQELHSRITRFLQREFPLSLLCNAQRNA